MRLPPIKRLSVEDFKGQEKWIGKLLTPLNQIFQSLSGGLQHNLTFTENIASQLISVRFNNNSAELSPSHPIRITNALLTKPSCVFVGQALDISNIPQPLSGSVFPTWSYDSAHNQLVISALSGLVASQTYEITFLII